MSVLGLDIAQSTGWSVLDEVGSIIGCGLIKIKLCGNAEIDKDQLKLFRVEYLKLIEKFRPKLVVLESIYVGPNPKVSATLNQQRGIIIEASRCPILGDHLSTVRKSILGQGKKHDKKEVFNWAVKKFKLKDFKITKHNDITDSILLSFYGYQYLQNKDLIV